MRDVHLDWGTCGRDHHWCNLVNLNLPISGEPHGVYIIWVAGPSRRIVYVGQGDISARLSEHRVDSRIVQYERYGTLLVTWANVSVILRDSVERTLADMLNPLVGEIHPARDFDVQLNLPW